MLNPIKATQWVDIVWPKSHLKDGTTTPRNENEITIKKHEKIIDQKHLFWMVYFSFTKSKKGIFINTLQASSTSFHRINYSHAVPGRVQVLGAASGPHPQAQNLTAERHVAEYKKHQP